MGSNYTARVRLDALLENCFFYISRMYEFLHSLGHERQYSKRANVFRGSSATDLRSAVIAVAATHPFGSSTAPPQLPASQGGASDCSNGRRSSCCCALRTRDQTHKIADRVDPVDHPISDLEAGYLLLDRHHQFETVKPIGRQKS
jgi:hypothetical protein